MAQSYVIAVYWGPRKEAVDRCARRAAHLLKGLAECDPVFSKWFKLGQSREAALRHGVEPKPDTLLLLLRDGQSHVEGAGSHIGLWTGSTDCGSAGFSLNCGSYSQYVPNSCVINMPTDETIASRLLQAPTLVEMMRCMVTAWEPDWGITNPSGALDVLEEYQGEERPLVGWLTYLDTSPGSIPRLPSPVQVMSMGRQGSLVITTDERFTMSKTHHLQTASTVAKLLHQAGLRE